MILCLITNPYVLGPTALSYSVKLAHLGAAAIQGARLLCRRDSKCLVGETWHVHFGLLLLSYQFAFEKKSCRPHISLVIDRKKSIEVSRKANWSKLYQVDRLQI
jgi:hypothetical protein